MASKRSDVVIGYHIDDLEFVQKLAAKLTGCGISVWFTNLDSQLSRTQTSDAILGSKIYIPVMTEMSATDKAIQEQLSLAYISNSAIYPLSKIRYRYLSPKLSGGARLMLAKINWCFVFNMGEFDEKTDVLIKCVKKDLANMTELDSNEAVPIETHGLSIRVSHGDFHTELGGDGSGYDGVTLAADLSTVAGTTHFWDRHFKDMDQVPRVSFQNMFLKDYGEKIDETFNELSEEKQERKTMIINIIRKDIFKDKEIVTRSTYNKFCPDQEPHSFFTRLQEYILAYISLRNVISMDSSLRISTIQSLGQYSFPAIVKGLSDMLQDDDPNIRAVAAIALAKAGKDKASTVDKILCILEDEDRLVRESACLSLAFLRSTRAVPYIVDRWRNDPISTVREAAELALSKFETADARKSMKVAQVLADEVKALKPQTNV